MVGLTATSLTLSVLVSLVAVPLVRSLAKFAALQERRWEETTPSNRPVIGGGLAIFLAMVGTLAVATGLAPFFQLPPLSQPWIVLLLACTGMMLVGLLNDLIPLRGRQSLLLQIPIVLTLVGNGTLIERIGIFHQQFELGVFALPVSALWLLIAVNTLKLFDRTDGMAAVSGCIISFGLAILSLQMGSTFSAMIAFSLAGALLGFLVFNAPPASIVLGNAGTMTIGLLIGVLAVWSSLKGSAVISTAPLAILLVPLFDSVAGVIRRGLTGRHVFATDTGHMHHLLQVKYGRRGVLLVVACLCTITTAMAVLSIRYDLPWLSVLGLVSVPALLIATRSFGHSECRLLVHRMSHFGRSLLEKTRKPDPGRTHQTVSDRGGERWEGLWQTLVQFSEDRQVLKLKLCLNLTWLQESHQATWQRCELPEKPTQVHVRLPLFYSQPIGTPANPGVTQIPIGYLEIVSRGDVPNVFERLAGFTPKLAEIGPEIDAIIAAMEAEISVAVPRVSEPRGAAAGSVSSHDVRQSLPASSNYSGDTAHAPS